MAKRDDEGGGWVAGRDFRRDTNPETLAQHAAGELPDPNRQTFENVKAGTSVTIGDLPPQSVEWMKDAGLIVHDGTWRRARALGKAAGIEASHVIERAAIMRQAGDLAGSSWTATLDALEERLGLARVEAKPVPEEPQVEPMVEQLQSWGSVLTGDQSEEVADGEPQ